MLIDAIRANYNQLDDYFQITVSLFLKTIFEFLFSLLQGMGLCSTSETTRYFG